MSIHLDRIIHFILAGNAAKVREHVFAAIDAGVDPVDIVKDGLIPAMNQVGAKFECDEIYVVDLLIAARAMQEGLKELKPYLKAVNFPCAGRVVIGTVAGDLHDIGKNLLGLMLEAAGFEVIDLGVDVQPMAFVEAVVQHRPQVLCMSALLSSTINGMEQTILALKKAGLREQVKVAVGGAPVTKNLARKLGADAYAPDAVAAVRAIKDIMEYPDGVLSEQVLKKIFAAAEPAQLQAIFFSLAELNLFLQDPFGNLVSPAEKYSSCSDLCNLVREAWSSAEMHGKVFSLVNLREELNGVFAYRCRAGLLEIAYPLTTEAGKIGTLICGHFLLEGDFPPAVKIPSCVPVFTRERLDHVSRLLVYFGDRIKDLARVVAANIQLENQQDSFIHFLRHQHHLEEALRDAELKVLQSQVNPHFLFNSLNTVARLALLEGAEYTEKVVRSLARLMRYSLYQVKAMVTVQEEIKAVQDYLLIQETRFKGRIVGRVDVAKQILAARIPCMILQPLVENACRHGLEPLKEGGVVELRGDLRAGQVCFEITDNGVGIPEEVSKEIFPQSTRAKNKGQTTGVGIANVYRRLQYHFGSRCALDIKSAPGLGTKVYLAFPYEEFEREEPYAAVANCRR